MQTHRPFLTQHRLQRLVLWTLTLLSWVSAMLSGDSAVSRRQIRQRFDFISLAWLSQRVGKILIVRAAQLAPSRRSKRFRFWRHGRDLRAPHLFRSLLGARVRRALRDKDPLTWIAKLVHVLRNLDACAGLLTKRLNGGLTRLAPRYATIGPAVAISRALASAPASADSS